MTHLMSQPPHPPPTPPASVERETFEERVARRASRFDLKPLLELLVANGYPRDEIMFESSSEAHGSALIQRVTFRKKPSRGVVITMSLGLLGDNSLLPSYFFEAIEKSRDPDKFYDFIRFFDHRLIGNFLRAIYPEEDTQTYRDWPLVQRAFLKMLGFASTSTMQWLGQTYFPELRVRVTRRAFSNATASHAFRTGESKLDGSGVIGRIYESDATGFVLDVFAEEESDARGRAWPNVVRERLQQKLLPLLAPYRIPLVVRLTVLFHASWVKVDSPTAASHGFLGYERIRGEADSGHTLVIYRGVTGEATRA